MRFFDPHIHMTSRTTEDYEAMAAAVPPLEPPGIRAMSQGLLHVGATFENVSSRLPNSGVLVLPRITAPVVLSRSTTTES